jgi:putative ABC transport system substrate-binding protein
VARLAELGWIEGKTIAIEYRWSQGRSERYAEIAAEFVRLKVDVIVTVGSAVPIVRQATTVIPIVFAVGIDPVGSGLVASLAQPGGNVTGLSIQANELAGKRLEFARELVPQLHRLAIIFNVGNAQPVLEMGETQAAARMLGLEVVPLVIQRAEDIAPAFQGLKTRADALYVAVDQLMVANLTSILTSALNARLPTIFSTRDFVKAGALMSYGPSYTERFGRAADYVDKILHGAKPGDLPVDQPTKFELVINLTTAKALGLDVASQCLLWANSGLMQCSKSRAYSITSSARARSEWGIPSTRASTLGTDPAKRADGSRRSRGLVRSSPPPWLPRSATGERSAPGAQSCRLDWFGAQAALDRGQGTARQYYQAGQSLFTMAAGRRGHGGHSLRATARH